MKNKMWKKMMAVLLCAGMMAGVTACGQKTENQAQTASNVQQEEQTGTTDSETEAAQSVEATETGEETSGITETLTLYGEAYSGQARVTLTLNPDGTASLDGNGSVTEGTWELSDDADTYIVAHFEADGTTTDVQVSKTEDGSYMAPFTSVPGMVLTSDY